MIERSRVGEIEVLRPETARDCRDIAEAAAEALGGDTRTLLVDLSRVPALRGEDLERLAGAAFACERGRAALVLCGLSLEARKVIEILELGALFPYIYATRDEALETLRHAAIAPAGEAPLEIAFDDEPPLTTPPPEL